MSHVGVVFGGRSVEHQVSVASARTVARGLREAGHQVTPLGIAQDGCWLDRAAAAALLAGEEKAIPPLGGAVAPTLVPLLTSADFERAPRAFLARLEPLPLPLFVKPRSGGSSVGVKRLDHRECAETTVRFALQFDDAVLVERGIAGRELECAVLGYERIEASAVGEVVPGNQFYDYADKYLQDTARLLAPADLPPATAERIRTLAVHAFAALGGVGMARVDFLLEGDGSLFVNELNTLPGFTAISMYPRLWELAGVPLPQLTDRLVAIAIARHRVRRRLDDAIKSWLEEL